MPSERDLSAIPRQSLFCQRGAHGTDLFAGPLAQHISDL